MKKTLALVLVAACLYMAPTPPVFINRTLAASTKFYTVANPIPNQYIVVLATTDLSPVAQPASTPVGGVAKGAVASIAPASAMSLDSSSMSLVASPMPLPDPVVVATATDLTSTYGGTFSLTWSNALKGFRLNAT